MFARGLVFLGLNLLSSFALSSSEFSTLTSSNEDFHVPSYYVVKEDPRVANVDLMNFEFVDQALPQPEQPYNRLQHFGSWIDLPGDHSCQNTRAKVLVRETQGPVTFNPNGCTVKTGEWADPYTNKTMITAAEIQIDHLVPLKNAYMTGAFAWSKAKRCLYANYLGNNFHLLAVSGPENNKKGDKSPQGYIPPNAKFTCTYLKDWLEVKVIWGLRLTPIEADAIRNQFEKSGCDRVDFRVSSAELVTQRRYMSDHQDECVKGM